MSTTVEIQERKELLKNALVRGDFNTINNLTGTSLSKKNIMLYPSYAGKSGNIDIVNLYINTCLEDKERIKCTHLNPINYSSILKGACENGNIETVKYIINSYKREREISLKGSNLEYYTDDEIRLGSSLKIARKNGHIDVVNYLTELKL